VFPASDLLDAKFITETQVHVLNDALRISYSAMARKGMLFLLLQFLAVGNLNFVFATDAQVLIWFIA